MTPTALVTIQLDGWPPPTIEIRALVAALPQPEPGDSDAAPNAIQHLTELVLAFPTSEPDTDAGDAQESDWWRSARSRRSIAAASRSGRRGSPLRGLGSVLSRVPSLGSAAR